MPPQNDVEKFRQKAESHAQWSECDPMTVIAAARTKLYELPESQREQIEGPIVDALSRLESVSRAALGTGSFVQSESYSG